MADRSEEPGDERAGDAVGVESEAFTALYQSSHRVIERYVRLRVDDRELSQDLAAETFTIAWQKFSAGAPVTIRWLLKTARNLIGNEYQRRDHARTRMQQMMMEELIAVQSPTDDPARVEVRAAMARLRPQEALVLQLTYWYGLSAAESAQFLDCSTASLWQRLTRARSALRRELDDTTADDRVHTKIRRAGERHG